MSRQRDRDEFIGLMVQEGVPVTVARTLIRHGAKLHRLAERECNGTDWELGYPMGLRGCPGAPPRRESMKSTRLSTMYRQGSGWIVSTWSEYHGCYQLSHELPYETARAAVGAENCRHHETCTLAGHVDHHAYQRDLKLFDGPVCPTCSNRGNHGHVSRSSMKVDRLESRVAATLRPYHVTPIFSGDPRGAVLKLKVPSGRTNDWGKEGICVP